MAGCDEGGHVKNGSDLGTPAPNMALATKLAAVVIEWSDSGERSSLHGNWGQATFPFIFMLE